MARDVCFWHLADINWTLSMSAMEKKADIPEGRVNVR
jgi:hypothetical protein